VAGFCRFGAVSARLHGNKWDELGKSSDLSENPRITHGAQTAYGKKFRVNLGISLYGSWEMPVDLIRDAYIIGKSWEI
jgi:hypothetical protein